MGLLITVEGDDYTGKTSVVVPALRDYFKKNRVPVLVSREPGGTKRGEEIRADIFEKIKSDVPPLDLALLFNKARRIHLDEVIKPFLGNHKEIKGVVILDRYLDSTRVYQGLDHDLSLEKIIELEKQYVKNYFPDVTIILFIPEIIFEATIKERQANEREHSFWDKQTIESHLKRQRNYLKLPEISKSFGENRLFFKLDVSGSKAEVTQRLISIANSIDNFFTII